MTRRYRLTHVESVGRVTTLAARQLGLRPVDIDMDARLEDLGVDSLTLLALILEIEEDFDVDLDCYEALHASTLRHMAGMVELARAGKPALLF